MMNSREKFENWWTKLALGRHTPQWYTHDGKAAAMAGWQARTQEVSAVVPEGWKLIEVGFTPEAVTEAGVKCLHALKTAYCIDPRTVATAVFQYMLLAYASPPSTVVPEKYHVLDRHKAPRAYTAVGGDIDIINGWGDAIDAMLKKQEPHHE